MSRVRSGGLARVTGLVLDSAEVAITAKRLRHLKTAELADASPALLRRCAAYFRAASYNLTTAAGRFEHRADMLDYERNPDR